MIDAIAMPPHPVNEPVLSYAPGSAERATLKAEVARMSGETIDVPLFIDGREVHTGRTLEVRPPHDRSRVVACAHQGDLTHVAAAIEAAKRAHAGWAALPLEARSAVFLRAAELLAGPRRATLNAATMLGQSKTAHQAEIDSACELIDFLRFNVHFAARLASEQPSSSPGVWNASELRPLEGFVFASTPFNFTAIAGNLPSAPALMGNTVVWKPSPNAMLSGHYVLALLREAGLPAGVINLVQGDAAQITERCLDDEDLAGVHFTGSTAIFRGMFKRVGQNADRYKGFPRIVGETGGKDFVFAHASADVRALAVALVRGAFEYQGQKCSAASRAYVPRSIWPQLERELAELVASIKVGDVADFRNFMGAVIDQRAFARLTDAIARAKADAACRVVVGGKTDGERGFFVHPTIVEVTDPRHRLMSEELFGPVLSLWVYDDARADEALALVDTTTPYALTGAVFANDRAFVEHARRALRFSAGNFYVNDKPTGAVVGQQPFGGARASGTNDKAGSAWNLMRWTSPRTVKETLAPPHTLGYPFLEAE